MISHMVVVLPQNVIWVSLTRLPTTNKDEPSCDEFLEDKYYLTSMDNPHNMISSSLTDVFVSASKSSTQYFL